jgi:hypothetical protein
MSGYTTSTGSSNAYVVASEAGLAALQDGVKVSFIPNHTNDGAATLAYGGRDAKKILYTGSNDLAAGQIVAGQVLEVSYDASADSAAGAWIALNPVPDSRCIYL